MRQGDKRGGQRNRAAARTACILGGVALAIYAGALVLGHVGGLNASWEPRSAAQQTSMNAPGRGADSRIQQATTLSVSTVARASHSSSQP